MLRKHKPRNPGWYKRSFSLGPARPIFERGENFKRALPDHGMHWTCGFYNYPGLEPDVLDPARSMWTTEPCNFCTTEEAYEYVGGFDEPCYAPYLGWGASREIPAV